MALQTRFAPEEYLELEAKAQHKSEYRNGEIIPATGGTTNHNEISLNLATYLRYNLRKQDYRVYMADVRLWIPRYRVYTYPDVMLISGEPIYTDKSKTTVTNPITIAEVLSPSTQNYDLREKFNYYRSLPELSEYLLIFQQRHHIMQYVKTEAGWLLSEYESATINLAVGLSLEIAELYSGVEF